MTDRELLEYAAKAMGITPFEVELDGTYILADPLAGWALGPPSWKPLVDDGDCARMEAKLEIDVRWHHYVYKDDLSGEEIGVICGDYHGEMNASEPYGADKQAARRRASVRVAAMMGEKMP